MSIRINNLLAILFCNAVITTANAYSLPHNFVYLSDVDPTIVQEMRYAGYHNFLGRPIKGYEAPQCILTRQSAMALSRVQSDLKRMGYSLKVYDCYRPQRAVNDFLASHLDLADQRMKQEFYPRVAKVDFFKLGYVAEKSGHSRGSTIDLTIIPYPAPKQPIYRPGQALTDCALPYGKRFHDNSIDMGTGYDCFDPRSHIDNTHINHVAWHNRSVLQRVMEKQGFVPYQYEWWHFSLKDEPYPNQYFDFVVAR